MKKLFLILCALCAFSIPANATVFHLDSGIYNDGTFFVGPDHVRINDTATFAMCISINLHSDFGTSWDIQTFNLGGNLTGFSLYDGTAASFHALEEVGWLYSQTLLTTDVSKITAYQQAAWILEKGTDHSHDSYLINPASTAALALAGAQTFNHAFDSTIVFYQPTHSDNQFFVGQVPEPATIVAVGFFSLIGFAFWGKSGFLKRTRH